MQDDIYHNKMPGIKDKRENIKRGRLYIVPTPIGNFGDISLRALDTLKKVDYIVCEDTRRTRKLISHFNITKPLITYEKFSEARKAGHIIEIIKLGNTVALVCDAGMPGISDPGSILVSKARSIGVRVEALPGPSAFVTALAGSGYTGPFRFIEFFPRKKSYSMREIARMAVSTDTTVFYESPRRVVRTLKTIRDALGERDVCVAREITKIYEEYISGPLSEVILKLEETPLKGEITVIVKGGDKVEEIDDSFIINKATELLAKGFTKRDIIDILVREVGFPRSRIYDLLISVLVTDKGSG